MLDHMVDTFCYKHTAPMKRVLDGLQRKTEELDGALQ